MDMLNVRIETADWKEYMKNNKLDQMEVQRKLI